MSKQMAGDAFALLSGTLMAGGVLLPRSPMHNRPPEHPDSWEDQESLSPATPLSYDEIEIPDNIHTFKAEEKEKPCIKAMFPGLTDFKGAVRDRTTRYPAPSKKTRSCLVVNWEKMNSTKVGETDQWMGSMRFIWSVMSQGDDGKNKGFIVFVSGYTPNDVYRQEIQWEGEIYTVEEFVSGETKSWATKAIFELGPRCSAFLHQDLAKPEHHNWFPRLNPDLGEGKDGPVPEFWGLLNGTQDLNNIVQFFEDDVKTLNSASFRAYWDWKGSRNSSSGKRTLADWTKRMGEWWKKVWSYEKPPFRVDEFSEGQKGTWTQRFREMRKTSSENLWSKTRVFADIEAGKVRSPDVMCFPDWQMYLTREN